MAHQENHLHTIVDRFSTTTKLFGLTISLSKTEVLFQPAPGRPTNQPCIIIDGTQLSNVNIFKYLGSTITNDGSLDHEINARIQKASQALCGQVLHRNKTVWPDYQPQQNRGAVPTRTREANEPAVHYNRRHAAF